MEQRMHQRVLLVRAGPRRPRAHHTGTTPRHEEGARNSSQGKKRSVRSFSSLIIITENHEKRRSPRSRRCPIPHDAAAHLVHQTPAA
jgi:hypothetical protein